LVIEAVEHPEQVDRSALLEVASAFVDAAPAGRRPQRIGEEIRLISTMSHESITRMWERPRLAYPITLERNQPEPMKNDLHGCTIS